MEHSNSNSNPPPAATQRPPRAQKPPATNRRKPKRKTNREILQEQREQTDLWSSLEHLIATGGKRKHDAERRQVFRDVQEMFLEQQHAAALVLPGVHDTEEDIITNNDNENDKERKGDSRKPAASKMSLIKKKEVLTEDIRIYGEVGGVSKDGFAKGPWPKRLKKTFKVDRTLNNSDRNWEVEHGDSIHPLAFSSARLSSSSQSNKSDEQVKAINGSNLHVSTTDTSLSVEQVPRALLLRCWERAVHAACMTVPSRVGPAATAAADVSLVGIRQEAAAAAAANPRRTKHHQDAETNGDVPSSAFFGGTILGLGDEATTNDAPIIPEPTPVKEPAFVQKQRQTAKDRSATRAKCMSLGISLKQCDLPPDHAGTNMNKLACPVCSRVCENAEALRQHYFGGGPPPQHKQQPGCCWHKIPEKQTDVIAQVLETHVKSQVDEFMGLVMERAKERILEPSADNDGPTNHTKRPSNRLLNWHDILKFAETTCQSSHLLEAPVVDPRNGKHPLFETLQRTSNGVPLVLNPTILRTARERLVDRYANLPR
jgi:hypothetical protein